jgi:hypothetical protein
MADVIGGFLAFGLLHLRGVEGHAGWRWLFLVEVSPLVPISDAILMPCMV